MMAVGLEPPCVWYQPMDVGAVFHFQWHQWLLAMLLPHQLPGVFFMPLSKIKLIFSKQAKKSIPRKNLQLTIGTARDCSTTFSPSIAQPGFQHFSWRFRNIH
jgi:hypothetical protein